MSKITVIKVNKTQAPKGYSIVELAYKTEEGQTKGMRIFPFGDQKEVSEVAGNAKQGDVLEASFRKNAKGYWEFGSLKATGEQVAQAVTANSTGGRTTGYWGETAEERAAKQGKISKQAVLNTAVAYFEVVKGKPTVEQVIEVAQQLLDYVDGKQPQTKVTGDVE